MAQSNKWRVYIQPFDGNGAYTGVWNEVTPYVELDSLGTIDRSLDNTDYNIGIYRNSDFNMTLRNDDGIFSDVGSPGSMFRWSRTNSLVKVTWTEDEFADTDGLVCGFFEAGNSILCTETQIAIGLLSDKATTMDLSTQELVFTVLGLETVLTTTFVPFTSIFGVIDIDDSNFSIANPGKIIYGTDPPLLFSPLAGCIFQITAPGTTVLPNEITPSSYAIDYTNTSGSTSTTSFYGLTGTKVGSNWETEFSTSFGGSASALSGSPSGSADIVIVALPTQGAPSISSVIHTILNQSAITSLITLGSITVGQDANLDDWSDLNGMTVWDALSDLLLMSNSVLSINGTTLTVSPRTASVSLKYTFYGQASILGPENIQDIQNITNGIARTFNYFSWQASSNLIPVSLLTGLNIPEFVTAQNGPSIAKYGASVKTLSLSYIVDIGTSGARQTLLTSLLSEFGLPKQEFDLYTPINPDTLALTLLDRVQVDYPAVNVAPVGQQVPICGQAVCGESYLPAYTNFAFVENTSQNYKIEGKSIDPQTDLICFSMRRV